MRIWWAPQRAKRQLARTPIHLNSIEDEVCATAFGIVGRLPREKNWRIDLAKLSASSWHASGIACSQLRGGAARSVEAPFRIRKVPGGIVVAAELGPSHVRCGRWRPGGSRLASRMPASPRGGRRPDRGQLPGWYCRSMCPSSSAG